jgi:hypothetical protein
MNKSDLKRLIREVVEEMQVQEIDRVIQDKNSAKWNVNVSGIKVFFDITRFNLKALATDDSKSNPDHQTRFGSAIQIMNKIIHNDMQGVNHVGFVLRDGRFLDATNDSGVTIRDGDDMIEHPENYIVYNVGGDEGTLLKAFEELKKMIRIGKVGYDRRGIIRKVQQAFPKLWGLYQRFKKVKTKTEETGQKQFYCSELVANLLARIGVLSLDELLKTHAVNEELDHLDAADEIDPQRLYNLIKTKAKLVPIVPTNQ